MTDFNRTTALAEATASASRAAASRRSAFAFIALALAALAACALLGGCSCSKENEVSAVAEGEQAELTEPFVSATFEAAEIPAPDLSPYEYVSKDDLTGPKFSDITIGEPETLGAGGNEITEIQASATATFKNKGIELTEPVTIPFDYSVEGNTWVAGEPIIGDVKATPLASASTSAIVENLDSILTAKDPTIAEAMADGEVLKTTPELSVDGGKITVDLSRAYKDKKVDEIRTCTVELDVTWSETEGWKVSVANDPQVTTTNNAVSVTTSEGNAIKLGKVKFGDKVSLSGTLQKVANVKTLQKNNGYSNKNLTADANKNVQLVLVLNRPVDVTLNGKAYHLTTIAVATSGLTEKKRNSLIGRTADVSGPLEEAFATSWSPAGIKALKVEVQ